MNSCQHQHLWCNKKLKILLRRYFYLFRVRTAQPPLSFSSFVTGNQTRMQQHATWLKVLSHRIRHGTARHGASPYPPHVAAVQCNVYGKFQCESGNNEAVPCRTAPRVAVTHRAVPCRIRCERILKCHVVNKELLVHYSSGSPLDHLSICKWYEIYNTKFVQLFLAHRIKQWFTIRFILEHLCSYACVHVHYVCTFRHLFPRKATCSLLYHCVMTHSLQTVKKSQEWTATTTRRLTVKFLWP